MRLFKKEINSAYALKDFTKNYDANAWIENKVKERKSRLTTEKFSAVLNRKYKEPLSPYLKPDKRQLNRYLRKRTMDVLAKTEEHDMKLLSESLFTKDHTAQSLENLRKIQENKIFNRKMHEITEKKFALKLESRREINLIENYEGRFLNYERHNASTGIGYKLYPLQNFLPESRYKYAGDLSSNNPKYVPIESEGGTGNKYNEYIENKKRLENLRISSVLSGKKNNEELLKYLELINSNPSGNLIKTLTDGNESSLITNNDNKDNNTALIEGIEAENINKKKVNKVDNYFREHCELTSKINQYELSVYEEFKKLDIYNKYNKGIIKFSDLTLEENLNYIKFNINSGRDLFKVYAEVKNLSPIITCALVQKISIGYKEEKDIFELFAKPEYRDMLTIIKKNLKIIDNKNLADSLYAVSKIHKGLRSFSNKFFQHFLNETFMELNSRLKEDSTSLNFLEISFLLEGLSMLRISNNYDDLKVVEEEFKLAHLAKERILGNKTYSNMAIHPFHISKVLNYFYIKNDEDINKLLVHLGYPLMNFIKSQNVNDTVGIIDLVKIVSVYSWGIAREVTHMRKQIIGEDESSNIEIVVKDSDNMKEGMLQLYNDVLTSLKNPVINNRQKYEIKHASNLIYSYSIANIKDEDVYRFLQLQIDEQLNTLQEFKPEDIMFYTFAIARRHLREDIPKFNLDPNSIIYINLNEKNTSYKYITIKKFQRLMYEREKMFNAKYLSLALYSASIMGYSDMEFYLPIFHNIIVTQNQYSLRPTDIGYLMQTLAWLNYNDDNIINFLLNKLFGDIDELANNLKNEKNVLSISQVLTALVRLNARKHFRNLNNWQEVLEELLNYSRVNLADNPSHLISFYWFFTYIGYLFNNPAALEFLYNTVYLHKDSLNKYDKILLNQVYSYSSIYNINDKCSNLFSKEFLKVLSGASMKHEQARTQTHIKLSKDRYENETPIKRISRLIKENKALLNRQGLVPEENVTLLDSYIIPFMFGKKCLFIYDHNEILKSKTPTGYNVLLFEMILEKGYIPTYINTNDFINKTDKEVFDGLLNKIS
jgi:hypothetical protein